MNVFLIAPLKATDMMDHMRATYLMNEAEIPVVGLNNAIETIDGKREAVHTVRKLSSVTWGEHFATCFKTIENVDIVLNLHIVNSPNFTSSPREVILEEYAKFLNIPIRNLTVSEENFYTAGMPIHGDTIIKF